jgi:hypothetical protein
MHFLAIIVQLMMIDLVKTNQAPLKSSPLWYKAKTKISKKYFVKDFPSKIQVIPKFGLEGNLVSMSMEIVLFLDIGPFADCLFIKADLRSENFDDDFDAFVNSKVAVSQVGNGIGDDYKDMRIRFRWKVKGEKFNFANLNNEIRIQAQTENLEKFSLNLKKSKKFEFDKIDYILMIESKFDYNTQYLIYLAFLGVASLVQFIGFVIMCYRGVHEQLAFIREMPLIPTIQCWASDFILIFICFQSLNHYKLIYQIHLGLGVIGNPLVFKFLQDKNLFQGAKKIQNHLTLGVLGLVVILSNIMVLSLFFDKVIWACIMLLISFVLEGFVFNKRPKHFWYFWMYMVPKSFVLFYIYFYPGNLQINPINYKDFGKIMISGLVLFCLILVQKFWSPRFGLYLTKREREMERLRARSVLVEKLIREMGEGFDGQCAICWAELGEGTDVGSLEAAGDKESEGKLFRKKKVLKTGCGHCFHDDCLKSWLKKKKSCPMCRVDVFV